VSRRDRSSAADTTKQKPIILVNTHPLLVLANNRFTFANWTKDFDRIRFAFDFDRVQCVKFDLLRCILVANHNRTTIEYHNRMKKKRLSLTSIHRPKCLVSMLPSDAPTDSQRRQPQHTIHEYNTQLLSGVVDV
jgi:hypothetical protein